MAGEISNFLVCEINILRSLSLASVYVQYGYFYDGTWKNANQTCNKNSYFGKA